MRPSYVLPIGVTGGRVGCDEGTRRTAEEGRMPTRRGPTGYTLTGDRLPNPPPSPPFRTATPFRVYMYVASSDFVPRYY